MVLAIVLTPLCLILLGTLSSYIPMPEQVASILAFLGKPFVALTIATLVAMYLLGARRGYTGAVKRWGHHILRMTHGTGPIHRQVGSMGANSTPSRVFKNKKMAGQYGNEQVTILNLAVVKIDPEKNLIAVKGAIPGARGGIVFIRDSVKA